MLKTCIIIILIILLVWYCLLSVNKQEYMNLNHIDILKSIDKKYVLPYLYIENIDDFEKSELEFPIVLTTKDEKVKIDNIQNAKKYYKKKCKSKDNEIFIQPDNIEDCEIIHVIYEKNPLIKDGKIKSISTMNGDNIIDKFNLNTTKFEKKIRKIINKIPGFTTGKLDIIYGNINDLTDGKRFYIKNIEGSESTDDLIKYPFISEKKKYPHDAIINYTLLLGFYSRRTIAGLYNVLTNNGCGISNYMKHISKTLLRIFTREENFYKKMMKI